MKRGRLPEKGIGPAIKLAENLGLVMVFQPSKKNIATFVIVGGNGIFTIVSVRFTGKLWPDIPEIEFQFHDAIAALGLVTYGGTVSRELWLYNRHGTIRKFRLGPVGLIGIVERSPDTGPAISGTNGPGNSGPVVSGPPGQNSWPAISGKDSTDGPDSPASVEPGNPNTLPPIDPVVAAHAQAHGLGPRSPIIRWLMKIYSPKKPVTGAASRPGATTEKIRVPGKLTGTSGDPVPAAEDPPEATMPEPPGVTEPDDISHLYGRFGSGPR